MDYPAICPRFSATFQLAGKEVKQVSLADSVSNSWNHGFGGYDPTDPNSGAPTTERNWLNKSVHVCSDRSIACYISNTSYQPLKDATELVIPSSERTQRAGNYSADSSLALPTDAWGSEYLLAVEGSSGLGCDRSQFAVVAAQDNTIVEIIPSVDVVASWEVTNSNSDYCDELPLATHAAGTPYEVLLQRGDGLFNRDYSKWCRYYG